MKRIILLAVLMIGILYIPYVSAAAIGTYINSGATVFVGEEGLNITEAVGNYNTIGWWASSADISRSPPDRKISITNRKNSFSVTPSEFSSALGNWYKLTSNDVQEGVAFNVINPYLDIILWNKDTDNPISNNQITSGSQITFKINSNFDTIPYNRYMDSSKTPVTQGVITIKVTSTDTGASYTKLLGSDDSLENIFIQQPNQLWGGTWDTDALNDDGIRAYPLGDYTIYAETNFNRIKDNYQYNGADYIGKTVSALRTVTITQSSVSITAPTSSVIKGKPFMISVLGSPYTKYYIWLKNTNDMDITVSSPPKIQSSQVDIAIGSGGDHITSDGSNISDDVPSVESPNPYYAIVTTDSTGKRDIAFSTSSNTKSQKYTIRIESDISLDTQTDEVDITVENGGMSIVAEGDQIYYLGEPIKFSGVNTESSITYLMIYGPNLPPEGAQITKLDPRNNPVINNDATTFKQVTTDGSGEWSWSWSTASLSLDAGTYIIYATSLPRSRSHLSDGNYATTSVKFGKPTLSATVSSPTVAKGEVVTIKGYAEGQPSSGVAIWIMGVNYAKRVTAMVNSDASYSYEIKRATTEDMSAGQYYVVVQHPMQNNKFDVILNSDGSISNLELGENGTKIFQFEGSGSLQGSDAANALIEAIEDANIDDMYTKLYFTISNPVIIITDIGDKYVGEQFTLMGHTNLNIDSQLTVDIISSSFGPTNKSQSGEFSGASFITKVIRGDAGSQYNNFEATISTATFKPDKYIIKVESLENDISATQSFLVKTGQKPSAEKTYVAPIIIKSTTAPIIIESTTVPPAPVPTQSSLIPGLPGYTTITAIIGLCIATILIRIKIE